jgi:type II secretory pathway pseudopilin PulG
MITVAVIGTLLMVAVPSFRKVRRESKIEQARSRVEVLAAAIKRLAWDTGRWPGAIARNTAGNQEVWDLTTQAAGLVDGDVSVYKNWQGPYIRAIANDPWGQPYFFDPDYRVDGENRVVVGSFGPNRQGRNLYDSDDIYVLLDD